MRCDAMRCNAMRCHAMGCDQMEWDGMGCDQIRSDPIHLPDSLLEDSYTKIIFVTGNTTIDKYTINSLTEYDFGIKSNGDLSVDGATVPFGRYCVNLKPPSQDHENFTEEVHFCTTYRLE